MIAKYTSTEEAGRAVPFDERELMQVYVLLGVQPDHDGFKKELAPAYMAVICQAVEKQNRTLTELTHNYSEIRKERSEVDAAKYLLDHLHAIVSPFMLDSIAACVAYHFDRAS